MVKTMEVVLLNKYLVRTDSLNWMLSKVKDNKEPIVLSKIKDDKEVSDYSNFGRETYPNDYADVLSQITQLELKTTPGINTIKKLVELTKEIHNNIEELR
jgi:hypothetical protein